MKINKLHIISFGGLKNYTLNFEDGFNCIYGDNEQGKTTIMSFIKMMFYGNERGSSQISKNIRKKYTPWDGSPMAGSIEFENKGKCYKLEREFRSSNSTDKVFITDLSLGEKQSAESDIGVRLFGLSAAAFERSIFIGQLGFPSSDASAESELNARLSNIVSTGDEKLSLEDVTAKLEKERYSIISKSGKAGEYYKNSLKAAELSEKLNASVTANEQYLTGKEQLIAHSKDTNALVKRAEALKTQLSKEQDIKNAEKLRTLLETKESLEELKAQFTLTDGTAADENYLRNLKFSLSKLQNATAKAEAKKKETEIVKNQLDTLINGPKLDIDETPEKLGQDLNSLQSNLHSLQNKACEAKDKIDFTNTKKANAKSVFNPILLIMGIVLLAMSPLSYFILNSYIPSIALGLVLIIISFILKPKSTKKARLLEEEISSLENILINLNDHIKDVEIQINQKKTKLEAIKLASTSNSQVIEAMHSQLTQFQAELTVLKSDEELLKGELNGVLGKFDTNADINEALNALETVCERQKELKSQINFLLKDLNNISYEQAKEKLAEIEKDGNGIAVDFEKIKAEYEVLLKEITERKAKESALATELKAIISNNESPDVLSLKLKEIGGLLTAQKEFCDSVDIAVEVLKESFAELRSSYGSELEKKSAEIFSLLTKGKYAGMTISKSFGINVEEALHPISRESEYLSSGTADLAYLSLRLAVAQLLAEDLPLFLDDSLTQYDDTRAKATMEFLQGFLKNNQGIMFTCHKSIFETAKSLGCKTKKL